MGSLDWLEITLNSFKESGKWGYENTVLIPNNISGYERREFLRQLITENLPKGYYYFSVDSGVLGYPFMLFNK